MTSAELAERMNLSHDFIRQIQCKGKKTANGYKPYNFSVDTFLCIACEMLIIWNISNNP